MLGTTLRSLFRTSVHLQNIHILHIIMKIYIFHSFMFVRLCYQVSHTIIKREQFLKREWTLTIFVIYCVQVFSFECMNKPNVWTSIMLIEPEFNSYTYTFCGTLSFFKKNFYDLVSLNPDQIVKRIFFFSLSCL